MMKRIMLLFMILFLFASWFVVIFNGQAKEDKYNECLAIAKQYISEEIYIDAIDYYKKAISYYPNKLDNKIVLANIYKQAKMYNSFEKYCIDLSREYSGNEDIICMLADYYIESGKDEKAIKLYKLYLLEYKDSEVIANKLKELKSSFTIEYKTYAYISNFQHGYAVFQKSDKYGIMDENGNEVIKAIYDYTEVFNEVDSLKLALVSKNGEFYYIDTNGNKRRTADISDKKYEDDENNCKEDRILCGLTPVLVDGKWGYQDEEGKIVISPQFNGAKAFNSKGIAPILKKEWQLLKLKMPEVNRN